MASREPHPYALLSPPLSDEEYRGLKADIAERGVLYPIIVDEDDRILDGVHRWRIADELGIDPPVSQMGHLDDEGKLALALGLNLRRRHLDPDRRRDLARRLRDERGLSVRRISKVTGWSKSQVHRDLTGPRLPGRVRQRSWLDEPRRDAPRLEGQLDLFGGEVVLPQETTFVTDEYAFEGFSVDRSRLLGAR
jgi:ParB-like chromosome segregation protein Spo0J